MSAVRRAGKRRLIAKGGKIRIQKMRTSIRRTDKRTTTQVASCIGCGCDDNNACLAFGEEPCHWIAVNRARGVGVCSECAIKMFNAILFPEESDVEIHRSIMAAARS